MKLLHFRPRQDVQDVLRRQLTVADALAMASRAAGLPSEEAMNAIERRWTLRASLPEILSAGCRICSVADFASQLLGVPWATRDRASLFHSRDRICAYCQRWAAQAAALVLR